MNSFRFDASKQTVICFAFCWCFVDDEVCAAYSCSSFSHLFQFPTVHFFMFELVYFHLNAAFNYFYNALCALHNTCNCYWLVFVCASILALPFNSIEYENCTEEIY